MGTEWPEYWSDFPDLIIPGFTGQHVMMPDGALVSLFEAGPQTNDRIYVIGPIGTPILLLAPLIKYLSREYRVTFWELRGGSFLDDPVPAKNAGIDQQARDFAHFVGMFPDDTCHVVAWCSGVQIAARGAPLIDRRLDSLSLIAPSGLTAADMDLPFMRGIMPLLERISTAKPSVAERLCELVRQVHSSKPQTVDDNAQARLQMLNFESSQRIESFAKLATSWCRKTREELLCLLADLVGDVPTQIVHCKDDDVCSFRSSLSVFESLPLSKLTLHAEGGHWFHFRRPDIVGSDTMAFIKSSEYGSDSRIARA